MWASCELSVSLQLTQQFCCELLVRSSRWAHQAGVAVSSQWKLQIHRKLTASSQCKLILWVCCELDEWPQNELAMSLQLTVSSLLPLHGELFWMISWIAHSAVFWLKDRNETLKKLLKSFLFEKKKNLIWDAFCAIGNYLGPCPGVVMQSLS